jgi:2-polyprenyl-6-methoxyphenol hydroxylase-like FAD-dependent oxidoreductase
VGFRFSVSVYRYQAVTVVNAVMNGTQVFTTIPFWKHKFAAPLSFCLSLLHEMKFLGRQFLPAILVALMVAVGANSSIPTVGSFIVSSTSSRIATTVPTIHEQQSFVSVHRFLNQHVPTVGRKLVAIHSSTTTSDSTSSSRDSKVTSIQQPTTQFMPPSKPASYYDAIISGGGPAGLLTAIMLSQKYGPSYRIAVCERRAAVPPSPSDATVWNDVARFYLLGIGHRGQSAMQKFGVLEDFIKVSVEVQGRRDWQPGMTKVEDGRITVANKDPPSRVLARDKLVGLFHEHLVENYILKNDAKIDLLYGYEAEPISFGTGQKDDPVIVRISKCDDVTKSTTTDSVTSSISSVSSSYAASQDSEQICSVDDYVEATTNFLVGADGASRTVARAMEAMDAQRHENLNLFQKVLARKPFRITRFKDDNPRVFKSVPIFLPPDWPRGLNYSARSRNSRITLEALPSDNHGSLCALLLMRPDDELAQPDVDPSKLRHFFDQEFPQFGALVDDEEMARVAKKPSSMLPVFRFAGPRLSMGFRTLVLGDAAHTVKP